jgi:hypothetical protein
MAASSFMINLPLDPVEREKTISQLVLGDHREVLTQIFKVNSVNAFKQTSLHILAS